MQKKLEWICGNRKIHYAHTFDRGASRKGIPGPNVCSDQLNMLPLANRLFQVADSPTVKCLETKR